MSLLNGNNKKGKKGKNTATNNGTGAGKFVSKPGKSAPPKTAIRTGGTRGS